TANPYGLHLTFSDNEELSCVESQVLFPAHVQGWEGVVHGGIISTVLDEIMIKAAAKKKMKCVTGEITVKFKQPVRTDMPYLLQGKVAGTRGKLVFTEGALLDRDGEISASAGGKLFLIE
ncbi:MAG: hypothetical protein L0Y73_03315, partial [Candidatus Aminicenantes bacterium]|nr:hypothetical protein [Candidatus Aminicenantes bacterium]